MSTPTLSRTPESPAATRAVRPGWRDPRLALGVGLVALCALLGARLLSGADDMVAVWTLRQDAVTGQELGPGDLEATRVRFGSSADADRYVSAAGALPRGTVLTRDVTAGELLPREAVGSAEAVDLVELPVTVPVQAVPSTLVVGDTVDVWVTPNEADDALRALEGVRVLALPAGGSSLGTGADRQIIVGLDGAAQDRLSTALALLAGGTVVITSRAG